MPALTRPRLFRLRRLAVLAGTVSLMVLFSACGGGGDAGTGDRAARNAAGRSVSPASHARTPAGSEAAEVRARLTALLRQQAALTALTTQVARASGFHSVEVERAIAVLHRSGRALVHVMTKAQGPQDSQRDPDRESRRMRLGWRDHVQYTLAYVKAAIDANELAESEAKRKLFDTDADLAELFADMTDGVVTVEEAHGLLGAHVGMMLAMVDEIAAGEASAAESTVQVGHSAGDLAGDLARGFASGSLALSGSSITQAATLRAQLTGLLTQHAAQVVVVAQVAADTGADSQRTKAAVEMLRTNADELTSRIETAYGKKTGEAFATLLDRQVTSLVRYAKTGSGSLNGFPAKFTDVAVRAAGGKLAKSAFARAARKQQAALTRALDAVRRHDTRAPDAVQTALTKPYDTVRLLLVGA